MHRRQYLASGLAAASGLGGCLALPDGGTPPTPRPSVMVVGRDDPPDLPIRPSVEVVGAEASIARPPELLAGVENTADYPIEVGEERAVVFAFVSSEQRPGLTLLSADGDYSPIREACWRLAEPVAIPEYYGVIGLEPGERAERRIRVWGSPDGDGCLPTGEFRFATTYAGARDRGEGLEEQEWSGSWGFTLALE